jgi:ParB/RepB/Spo0J family partition protein
MTDILEIPLAQIHAGANDRTVFDQNALQELADSIKAHGLIQPITVRLFAPDPRCVFGGDRLGDKAQYEIVAGERRFRACQLLDLPTIKSIVVDLTDEEAAAIMLSENVSRKDLDPIDEARAYKIRIEKFGWSETDCAKNAGVTEIRVRFRLKLLGLRDDLQFLVRSGNLSLGYAQTLADASLDPNRQSLAVTNLRDNPHPTPGWFRNIVNQYAEQQNQTNLFDSDALLVCQEAPAIKNDLSNPPHPSTTTPPVAGKNKLAVLKNQAGFWREAAQEWKRIGKPFKSQECEAAAQAVLYAANLFV